MEDYDPCTESSYPMYLDVNNLYGWVKPQKLPIDGFKIKKNKLHFYEDFKQNYDDSDADTPLKLKLIILRNYRKHIWN